MHCVLGIESSCDETAAAMVMEDGSVRAHVLISQFDAHSAYGGVVPEIAAREHIRAISPVIQQCILQSGLTLHDITAVAATTGPGLIGGVMVGAVAAKALALSLDVPFLPVNHLAAHALVVRQAQQVSFPYLLLLVSGGHCQIVWVEHVGSYRVLGRTRDDALGEAFDKCAKLMGLGFPGGPALERAAERGNDQAYAFPRPMHGAAHADFSFSGLKTALRLQVEACVREHGALTPEHTADIAASFQRAACESVMDRLAQALNIAPHHPQHLVITGGVAANQRLRTALTEWSRAHHLTLAVADAKLCTDNGVMIAWAGIEQLRAGMGDDLCADIRARWPLE